MSPSEPTAHHSHDDWLRQQRIVRQFEAAWAKLSRPSLDAFLPENGPGRGPLLRELVHTDLEYRLKAGDSARVEDYLTRYPELEADRDGLLELILAEHSLRRRREPELSLIEYERRFPQCQHELDGRVQAGVEGDESAQAAVKCPDCYSLIRVALGAADTPVSCTECGTQIHLASGDSIRDSSSQLKKIGKYQLEEVVGRGSFGLVYRARDTELDRAVAVKIPRLGALAAPEDIDRFLREAKSAAQLRHPHIVAIHDAGRIEGTCFLVADYVPGTTLAARLRQGALPFRQAAALLIEVAEALHYAHEQGIVHRDLKPSNILLDAHGEPHLLDFGLARRETGDIRVTMEGQVLGTPAYMAPEQARGESQRSDARADVYSLGVILYEMLTGELPFRGNVRMVLQQVLEDEPRSLRRLNDRIPRDLETIALKALAKEPGRRYATTQAFADDLARWQRGEPILARAARRVERAWRWCRRNRRVAVLGSVVLTLLVCLAGGSLTAAFLIAGEKQNAVIAKVRAKENAARADEARKQADENAARADEARKQAEAQEKIASEHFQLALDALGTLVGGVQDTLTRRPGLMPLQQKLSRTALDGLKKIAAARKSTEATINMGLAHERLGDLFMKLNRYPEARQQYDEARRLARALVIGEPRSIPARRLLANVQESLAGLAGTTHLEEKILTEEFGDTLEIREALYRDHPDNADIARELAHTYASLGEFYRMYRADFPTARSWYEKGLAVRERMVGKGPAWEKGRNKLYQSYDQISIVCGAMHDVSATKMYSDKALAEAEALRRADPADPAGRRAVAVCHERRGLFYLWVNNFNASNENYRQALELRKALVAADPDYAPDKAAWAVTWRLYGESLYCAGRYDDARAAFRENLSLGKDQVKQNPGSMLHLSYVLLPCQRLAELEEHIGRYPEALDWLRQGLHWCEEGQKTALKTNTFLAKWKQDMAMSEPVFRVAAAEGVDNPDAIRKHPPAIALGLFSLRALRLARLGQPREALAALDDMRAVAPVGGNDCLETAARVYSLCLGCVVNGPTPNPALRKRYTDAAITALRELVHINSSYAPSSQVLPEPDFAALRAEPAYEKLTQETLRLSNKK